MSDILFMRKNPHNEMHTYMEVGAGIEESKKEWQKKLDAGQVDDIPMNCSNNGNNGLLMKVSIIKVRQKFGNHLMNYLKV